jgi:thymidylate kinase
VLLRQLAGHARRRFALTTEPPEISPAVTAIFRAWQQAEIDFLILRNYERLPAFTTNDIDVLVNPEQLGQAEAILETAARQAGFRLHNRAEFATLALYLSHTTTQAQLHFDLFTDLKWRAFAFLDSRDFLSRKVDHGLFAAPHPADEAATNLLAYLIYSGKVKEKYKASIVAGFQTEPEMARSLLARTYGADLAALVVQDVARQDWLRLESRTVALRRALIFRQTARRPWATLGSLVANGARVARRFLEPPGLAVVLCGADGCGKSTAASALFDCLSGTFSSQKGRHYHWKPPLFSARRRATRGPVIQPHAASVRGRAASLAFFVFHWLEFCLGSLLHIRPITFRGGLVVIDRFYYDFFVDQRRYRLNVPQWLVRAAYRLLPKPDLVFLLDAPPEVLRRRKQEVTPEETARQQQAYLALIKGLPNGRIIDASQSAEKVAAALQKEVLDFLAARLEARRGKHE